MNAQELKTWKSWTRSSEYHWTVDPVQSSKPESFLIHKGGMEKGVYFGIQGSELSFGYYEGADPHIGEAFFTVKGKRTFASHEEAFAKLMETGGVAFILAATQGQDPYRRF